MVRAIGVKIDAEGRTIVVYAPRKARGAKTWGVRAPRTQSQQERVGAGARHLYR